MDPHRLVLRSAGEQLAHLRSGAVAAAALLDAQLERLTDVDRVVRAVVHLDTDAARRAARHADVVAALGARLPPLHGLTVTVKDWIDVAGMPCSGGAAAQRWRRPERDASAVARLRAAGAIVLAKTNPAERSEAFGPTFNPHDPSRTPTGSSSGEAALVAAAGSPLGLGSDSGGSLRQPAHACGVCAIRPSSGRVPLTGHYPFISPLLDPRTVIGPLARSVDDLTLSLRVIQGPDGEDPSALPLPLLDPDDVDVARLRVAWWAEQPGCHPTDDTLRTLEQARHWLEAAGVTLVEDRPDALEDVEPLTRTYWSLPESEDDTRWVPSARSPLGADDVQRFRFEWDRFRSGLTRFMARYDAVLTPAAERPAVPHGDDAGSIAPTLTFSLGGQPAVVVPCGRSDEGLPIGLQVAARLGDDHVALAVARVLERAGGGWWPPGGVGAA